MEELDKLIQERKKIGMTRKLMSKAIGYSQNWLMLIENKGERRVSAVFVEKYKTALENYKKLMNG